MHLFSDGRGYAVVVMSISPNLSIEELLLNHGFQIGEIVKSDPIEDIFLDERKDFTGHETVGTTNGFSIANSSLNRRSDGSTVKGFRYPKMFSKKSSIRNVGWCWHDDTETDEMFTIFRVPVDDTKKGPWNLLKFLTQFYEKPKS